VAARQPNLLAERLFSAKNCKKVGAGLTTYISTTIFGSMKESQTDDRRDRLFNEVSSQYGAALQRLAGGYEMDAERRRDLLQEIHVALWVSLENFDGRCSLRTWVYRVANNVATNHAIKDQRTRSRTQLGLEEMECADPVGEVDDSVDSDRALRQLNALIHQLKMPDRQIMLLYLDDVDGKTIAEITGISAGNVATRIHRIKKLLTRHFHTGMKNHV
jgi:RNA polymerase sigma-70 factor, ECF subfamily